MDFLSLSHLCWAEVPRAEPDTQKGIRKQELENHKLEARLGCIVRPCLKNLEGVGGRGTGTGRREGEGQEQGQGEKGRRKKEGERDGDLR